MLRVADHAKRTDTGRQRPANEDSHFVRAPLFVVADGMGGAQAGEVASQTAVEVFAGGLPDGPGSAEGRLAELVAEANARIHALALSDEHRAGMGTTLTAAYVGPDDVSVAHVGDSRLYRLRGDELTQLTDDHSLVGELVRRGQLSAEEAEDHPQRSIITRALGPEGAVLVDSHTWPAHDGDIFLLCSDGLTSMVPDATVAQLIRESPSLAQATQALVRAANDAGGRDNITVILFRVEEVTPQGARPIEAAHTVAGGSPATAPSSTARVPRPPRPQAPRISRRRRWAGPLRAISVVVVLVLIVASGAWIASRSVYFVGTDEHGFVTLYQGLPYDLPGLSLYQEQFISGVPAETLSGRVRQTVTDHKLRSQKDAVDLVRQLELGDLAGQT